MDLCVTVFILSNPVSHWSWLYMSFEGRPLMKSCCCIGSRIGPCLFHFHKMAISYLVTFLTMYVGHI